MSRYKKTTLKIRDNHTWTARPGCNVLVLDRGAVRLDYPRKWVVIPDPDSMKIHDRRPPNDDCVLAVSYMRIPPIDWIGLPLSQLVEVANEGDERPISHRAEIISSRRADMELAWREMHFIDPKEQRPARSRFCLARRGTVQAMITFDFWESDAQKLAPVWDTVLESLKLDDYIADPTRGPWGRG